MAQISAEKLEAESGRRSLGPSLYEQKEPIEAFEHALRNRPGRRYREVPLNLDGRRALQEYLATRPDVESKHIFIGQRRNGLTDVAVQSIVKKYAHRAKLEGVSPPVLQHTFGRSLLDKGVDLVTVQQLMSHKRIDSTARYTRASQRELEGAVARLEIEEA